MWSQLSELLLARVEFPDNTPQNRIDTYQAIARIYEDNMNDRESAFVVLQAAFREDFSIDSTARELERLASLTNKWGDLLGEYTQMVPQLPDLKARADLWVKIGRWYNEHLNRHRLRHCFAAAGAGDRSEPQEALTNLADCYRKTQQWPELVQVLEHHSNCEEEPQKKVEILLDLAALYENQLGNASQAIASYRRAITPMRRACRRSTPWSGCTPPASRGRTSSRSLVARPRTSMTPTRSLSSSGASVSCTTSASPTRSRRSSPTRRSSSSTR